MAIKIRPFVALPIFFFLLTASGAGYFVASKENLLENNVQELKTYVGLKTKNLENHIHITIEGVGSNSKFTSTIDGASLNSTIFASSDYKIAGGTQSISMPEAGIKVVKLEGAGKIFQFTIIASNADIIKKARISNKGDDLILILPKAPISNVSIDSKNLFSLLPIGNISAKAPFQRAVAPPLGDIAIGTKIIPNPNLINIEGPNVSLILKQTQARKAIEYLISKVDYGFVWVQNDPSFDPNAGINGTGFNTASTIKEEEADSTGFEPLSDQSRSLFGGLPPSSEKNSDTQRLITMTIKDQPFSSAFNAILMASGLQARVENGIIYVGPSVRDTVFSDRLSRVYRLNQTTANAAASYLANLGAKVTKTSTITTAVTEGAAQSQTIAGSSTSSTTTKGTSTSVEVYGSDIGPLVGLIATTDDRLQTVTMIGSGDIVDIAEGYLKQLDLRQRQVALTVRILDVNLSDGTTINNSWALKQNNNFIVNDNGKLLAAFGRYLPPNDSTDFGDSNTADTTVTTTTDGVPTSTSTYSRRVRVNPTGEYRDKTFLDFLKAQIVSKNTKILASPTLILNEYAGQTGGDTVSFGSISNSLTAGSIGRSFGNEAFVVVGTQVPVNCSAAQDSTVPTFTYGIKGLTFGARVMRIDDNGFVTFAISPSVTAPSEQRDITNCGIVDLLATRRLDSGTIRVKDGHTLILTGVLNSTDKETVTKWPLFGDLPLIGQFFRNTASSKEQNELVILVTPQILRASGVKFAGTDGGYKPESPEAIRLINEQ